ncbi:MAG: asparaginase, partial [Chloroflexi bacterium]|nr:asparaginase [Chloroflexota bacterium]
MPAPYQLLIELTRGEIVESVHSGALAVVDAAGKLHAAIGDPEHVTFLRSTAKPFQALPLIERGGAETYGLSAREIAILCGSHSGTDEHAALLHGLQARLGLSETDLQCGVHPPMDRSTAARLAQKGEAPTPNRHNCSGKHTGMLALALALGQNRATYLDRESEAQRLILHTFAEMCDLEPAAVVVGTDGCSAPNFAVPLRSAALALARLADPGGLPAPRARACRQILAAMLSYPEMVAGPGRFDTRLMQVGRGRWACKGGAEGYQGLALLPGALGADSPALGIALKIGDGDADGRARSLATLEVLRQLGALGAPELAQLAEFGPGPVANWRGLVVGEKRPA